MKIRPWLFALVLLTPFAASPARADTSLLLETDPSTFAFRGYAAHARIAPGAGHVALGGGIYALDFPKPLVDLNGKNRGEGWDVRLEVGGALFADYYLRPHAEGWFVGAELALQRYRYARDGAPGAHATNVVVMPRAGYQWRPFHAGFYVMPWAGLGVQGKVAGTETVGNQKYDVFPLVPYGALHLGWQLDL